MVEELSEKFAFEVIDLIKSGEISLKEAIECAQIRHETVDGSVNALPHTFFEQAKKKKQRYLI
jgi:hypothetical protein